MAFEIKGRKVGKDHPVFITFEAGPTHDGIQTAIELVNLAAEAGADAIKFQIVNPDKLVADKKLPFTYDILLNRATGETKTVSEPLYNILKRRSLQPEEWREVKQAADNAGIAFFATVAFEEEIQLVADLDCDSIKIASADVNHVPLLKMAAQTGMSIQLDTGNASLGEIEQAVDVIVGEGNDKIIIHQCPSGYPAHLESINLNMLKTLQSMFPFPCAYSDHTPGWDMDIAAVALGCNLVEKTITKDRMTPSVEHIMSIEVDQYQPFIQAIRDVEIALGGVRRVMPAEQIAQRNKLRRSAFFKADLNAGDTLLPEHIEYRRPGFGISPDNFERLEGKILAKAAKVGDMISWSDLTDER